MSFVQNYGVRDPIVDDDVETIFTTEEALQMQIDNRIAEEEAELEEIKEIDRELRR